MLDQPPREKEWLSWLALGLWSLVVFATIPLARSIQFFVQQHVGRAAFLYLVLGSVVGATALALRQRRARSARWRARLWLLGVAGVFGGYTFALRRAPEEALHFVQYGVLGVLAYRALLHRSRDAGIYACAALLGGIAGIVDEAIQWATPGRFWGLRDIWLNFFAAALVQVAIAQGLRPGVVRWPPSTATLRRACRLAAIALVLLGASLLNTPGRGAWLAERVPGLGHLARGENVMLEYGHLIEDPEIGRFRSRLTPEELARADAERAPHAAALLARYRGEEAYPRFLEQVPAARDAFAHEARVHLFRRDRYRQRAAGHDPSTPEHAFLITVAQRENRILERYFGRTLALAGAALAPAERARLENHALPGLDYESGVSAELVTTLGESQVVGLLLLVLAALAGAHRWLGRSASG